MILPAVSGLETPEWPLTDSLEIKLGSGPEAVVEECHEREIELWGKVWQKGQAVMWQIDGLEWQVAMFIRIMVTVETKVGYSAAGVLGELRQREEALGMTPPAMLRNKWRFAAAEELSAAKAAEAAEAAEAADRAAAKGTAGTNVMDLFGGLDVRAGT